MIGKAKRYAVKGSFVSALQFRGEEEIAKQMGLREDPNGYWVPREGGFVIQKGDWIVWIRGTPMYWTNEAFHKDFVAIEFETPKAVEKPLTEAQLKENEDYMQSEAIKYAASPRTNY